MSGYIHTCPMCHHLHTTYPDQLHPLPCHSAQEIGVGSGVVWLFKSFKNPGQRLGGQKSRERTCSVTTLSSSQQTVTVAGTVHQRQRISLEYLPVHRKMVHTAKHLNLDDELPLQMHGIANHLIAHAKELVHLSNIKILFKLLVLVFKMDARGLTKNHILKWPQGAMLKDPRRIYSYCGAGREHW